MGNHIKSKFALLRQKAEDLLSSSTSLSVSTGNGLPSAESEILKLIHELAFENEEKAKRADELVIANKELAYQNEEKEKRADELSAAVAYSLKLTHELQVHQIELQIQNEELDMQNKELALSKASQLDIANKYTEMYDFAPMGYFTLSREGKIGELNFSAASVLGKARSLLKNSNFGFFVTEETKPIFDIFIDEAFSSNTGVTCNVTLANRGNSHVYVHLSGIVKTNPERCLVTMVDITGIKLAEAAVQQSDDRHSSMISNISDVIGIIDADGFMIYKSPNIEKWFGWKQDDLIGTDGWLTVHPDDLERIQKEFHTLLQKDNSVTTVEYKYKCKDGSYKPIELTATNLTKNPVIGGVLLNYHDISGRKKNEQELKIVASRLALATRAGGVGVWDYDLATDILVWDDQMFALYGIDKIDFDGVYQAWQNGVHPADRERGDAEFQMAIRGEKEFDTEFRVIWANGSVHNIRAITVVHHDDSGKPSRMIGTNWDITDLRKAEKENLDDSENRYRSVFQGSSDGIMIADAETKMILFANTAQCQMLGYTEQELQTMNVAAIHPKGAFQDAMAGFDRVAHGEQTFSENIQFLNKDGKIFFADIASSLMTINGRKCIAGFFRNITGRKQAEDTLRKSEELFRSVVSNSSDLTTLTNANGIILFVSAQCETVLGYAPEKFVGIQMPDIIHPDDFELVLSAWRGVFHDCKELRELEYRIVDEKGAIRWLSHSAKPYHIDKIMIGVVSTIRNITDRKMAEQTIKVSEEKYKSMLNASPDCMVLTDMDGVIIEISEIGHHLLGADDREELLGKSIFQFVSPDEIEKLKELLVNTKSEGLKQNIGITIKKQNQTVFNGEISTTLMQGTDGKPLSFMIIIRDVSQRKKTEAKQIHADRMASLGEMAAGIAHEINQPLNIISMTLDNILIQATKSKIVDMGYMNKKSDKIFENITRMRDIIDHVRAFSRSDDKTIHTFFNVNLSIVNAASMMMEQFKHLGIKLNLQLDQQITPVTGNTYKFEQVVLNLLSNAKDAVLEKERKPEQDKEMIVDIRSYHDDQSIVVEVADNGIGISKDNIQNIMLPFFTTKEEGKGTGLGLSISHQIMKDIGGTIEFNSDYSTGTKVKLVLPVQKKK
ncbi:MAG: PAS domain S-box protein [Bacteroidales bacterium]